jgi:hypothetical protein
MENVEFWKPIKGFEGLYEISNLARVKHLAHKVWRGQPLAESNIPERILSNRTNEVVLVKDGVETHLFLKALRMTHFEGYVPSKGSCLIEVGDEMKIVTIRKMCQLAKLVKKANTKTSKYSGVSKDRGVFRASIRINGREVFLGRHKMEKHASEVYECAVKHEYLFKGDPKDFRIKLNSLMLNSEKV